MLKILLHAREAGVATIFKSLLQSLDQNQFEVYFDIADDAAKVINQTKKDFSKIKFDLVLYGIDDNKKMRTDLFLKNLKQDQAIKVGLLDSWKGLNRFWNEHGSVRGIEDYVIIMNDFIADYLINKGISKEKIILAQNPVTPTLQLNAKQSLGLNTSKSVLLFMSEPIKRESKDTISLLEIKVNQKESIFDFVNNQYGKDYFIMVRYHPIEKQTQKNNSWKDVSDEDLITTLSGADLVIGLTSTPMSYAVEMGKKVLSLDLQLSTWDSDRKSVV